MEWKEIATPEMGMLNFWNVIIACATVRETHFSNIFNYSYAINMISLQDTWRCSSRIVGFLKTGKTDGVIQHPPNFQDCF